MEQKTKTTDFNIKDIKVKLLPKQHLFYKSQKREVIYSGSFGSGKSVAICVKLLKHALIPGNLVLLTRKTRQALVSTTLRTLLIGDGKMPPVLPFGTYTHNEAKSMIKIRGGGTILYRGCDDDMAIRSLNLGAVAVDEAVELNEEEWNTLTSRLRSPVDPCPQIFAATNPSSPQHFLYQRWNKHKEVVDLITSTMDDNKHLPMTYVTDQKARYTGSDYKRYIMGEWCSAEGMVYPNWDSATMVKIDECKDVQSWIVGVDSGYSPDPCVMALIAVLPQIGNERGRRLHVKELFYQTGKLMSVSMADVAERWRDKSPLFVIDPSAGAITIELKARGFRAEPANNKLKDGISSMRDCIDSGRFTIEPNIAKLFIEEINQYSYDPGTELPKGGTARHVLDSCRYAILRMQKSLAGSPMPNFFILDGEGNSNLNDLDEGWQRI